MIQGNIDSVYLFKSGIFEITKALMSALSYVLHLEERR